jgi:hypothetical protein
MSIPASKIMYVRDPVLGSLRLSRLQEDLLKTVEVQRLSFVHQLGTTFQCYPGAHGMRLSHALGVSTIAARIGRSVLGIDGEDPRTDLLEAAGMLHDIGHTPWSHTLEPVYIELHGGDHMDLVAELVTGAETMSLPGSGLIPGILRDHGLDPADVAGLITSTWKGERYLQQIIFGEVDADMLDYLQRDFHFTGVSYGHIEVDRIISTMMLVDGRIVFLHKALDAVRDFLTARLQMYSSVYLHRKTRIVDQMLSRAARRSIVELGEIEAFHEWTDDELLSFLVRRSGDPWVREMAWRVKYRQKLFKQVFRLDAASRTSEEERLLEKLRGLASTPQEAVAWLEEEICRLSGAPRGSVIVDMPLEAVRISEERFEMTDIMFAGPDGRTRTLAESDPPFAAYLAAARPNRSLLSICCCPDHAESVGRACSRVLAEAAFPLFGSLP